MGNTPGVLARCTADLAFALLMCAARRVGESERWVRNGEWQLAFHPLGWLGVDVHGATLGIIGLGEIGLEMVKTGQGIRYAGAVLLPHPQSRTWKRSTAWSTRTCRRCWARQTTFRSTCR